jgi:hypothetical protein
LLLVTLHNGIEKTVDWVKSEHTESTFELSTLTIIRLGSPFLGTVVEVVITPKSLHHLVNWNTELLGVKTGDIKKSESPGLKTRTESNSTFSWNNLDITKSLRLVSRNGNVKVFNSST